MWNFLFLKNLFFQKWTGAKFNEKYTRADFAANSRIHTYCFRKHEIKNYMHRK